MKRNILGAVTLSSVLLLGACGLGNTMKVEQQEGIDAAQSEEVAQMPGTIGLIDDITDERILITVEESSVFNGKMKGQRIFFSTGEIDDETKAQLKRGQKVKIEHGEAFGMSHPPVGNAENIEVIDKAMSEQPHVMIFKYDRGSTDYLRHRTVTGAAIASVETVLEEATWKDAEFPFDGPADYQFSVETASSPFKEQNIFMQNTDDGVLLYNAATEQKTIVSGGMSQKLVELIK